MHANVLPWNVCVPSSVLIAKVVFLLERGHADGRTHTHKVTDVTDRPSHVSIGYAAG